MAISINSLAHKMNEAVHKSSELSDLIEAAQKQYLALKTEREAETGISQQVKLGGELETKIGEKFNLYVHGGHAGTVFLPSQGMAWLTLDTSLSRAMLEEVGRQMKVLEERHIADEVKT